MHFRKGFKRLRDRIARRLGAIFPAFAASANPSVTSLPNIPTQTQGGLSPPLGHHSRFRSDSNIPTVHQMEAEGADQTARVGLRTTGSTGRSGGTGLPSQLQEATSMGGAQPKEIPEPASQQAAAGAGPVSWTWLEGLSRIVTGGFGPLKAIVDDFVACVELYDGAASNREDFRALQIELEAIFKDLQHHFSGDAPPTITGSIESLCQSIRKELEYVKRRQTTDIGRRIIELQQDADNILACYRRVKGHLQRLTLNANLSIWSIVDELATDARLDRLSPSHSACYNSRQAAELKRGECTPGTRVDVLAQMHDWVYDRAAGTIYWLNGMAGTGKTTIAYSLCAELDHSHNLAASFFCSRSLPECRDVNQIVPSIAYQLARFSRPYLCGLSRVLEFHYLS